MYPSKYQRGIPVSLVFLVSEWLLLKANSAIFQLYHGENKLIFNELCNRQTRLVGFL